MSEKLKDKPVAPAPPSRLIAVATADGVTLSTHGGRVRRFQLYRLPEGGEPVPAGRIDLPEEEVLHLCGDGRPHAIDAVSAVIVGASGEGFVKHMQRRGIEAATAATQDVGQALADYLAGALVPADPPPHPHEHHDEPTP